MHTFVIAAIIVLVILAAYLLYRRRATAAPRPVPGAVYTQMPGGYTPDPADPFACAESSSPGNCFVSQTQAEAVCNANPSCVGYMVPNALQIVGLKLRGYTLPDNPAGLLSVKPTVAAPGLFSLVYYAKS